jgi:hypothetical protein
MVFDFNGEATVTVGRGKTFGDGPGFENAVHFQAEIVVKTGLRGGRMAMIAMTTRSSINVCDLHVHQHQWIGEGNCPGHAESSRYPCLAFCEGGGDLLAALHFIWCEDREPDCTVVAMLGASLNLHPKALPLLARKRVRIFGHIDPSGVGHQAVERWSCQLARVGADVDAFDFTGLRRTDGALVKDLNDCTSIHADDFESNRELWRMLP